MAKRFLVAFGLVLLYMVAWVPVLLIWIWIAGDSDALIALGVLGALLLIVLGFIPYLNFVARFFGEAQKLQDTVRRGVEIANLGERINDKVDTYSKGMTRRLLVGRALMTGPRLAILDEPTSGLDVINAQEVRKIVNGAVEAGVAVLLSSHNMLEVELLCHRIALMNDGRIIASGTVEELKKEYDARNVEEAFVRAVR